MYMYMVHTEDLLLFPFFVQFDLYMFYNRGHFQIITANQGHLCTQTPQGCYIPYGSSVFGL